MKISEETVDKNTLLVTLGGRLDAITSIAAQKKLLTLLHENKKNIILNLARLEHLSSAGIRTLIVFSRRAKELSIFVCLINLTHEISEVLEIAGLLPYLHTYSDLTTALANVKE